MCGGGAWEPCHQCRAGNDDVFMMLPSAHSKYVSGAASQHNSPLQPSNIHCALIIVNFWSFCSILARFFQDICFKIKIFIKILSTLFQLTDFLSGEGANSGKIFISVIIASNLVFLVTMFKNICLVSPICQQMSIQTQSLSHPQTFPECIHNVFILTILCYEIKS